MMSHTPQLEEEEEQAGSIELTLERLISSAAAYGEEHWEATEQDPDVLDDPIMQLDLQVCVHALQHSINVLSSSYANRHT